VVNLHPSPVAVAAHTDNVGLEAAEAVEAAVLVPALALVGSRTADSAPKPGSVSASPEPATLGDWPDLDCIAPERY